MGSVVTRLACPSPLLLTDIGALGSSMCAMHCQLHGSRRALGHTRSSSSVSGPKAQRPVRSLLRSVVPAASKWKVFGPTTSYSDGDAEFFRLSNSLADQYEWFAPRPEEPETAEEEQQQEEKPLYGLTPKQIAAFGLSGTGVKTPDPVSVCMHLGHWSGSNENQHLSCNSHSVVLNACACWMRSSLLV